MGAYLSTPVTTKEVFEGGCSTTTYGGGSMQGWRRTMEDAHIAETGLRADADVAIFGVFDGHGGAEVAKFCQKYMAAEMTKLGRFSEGGIEESLVEVFHRMDDMLRDHEYAEELEQLKTKDDMDDEDSRGDSEGDGVSMDAIEMLKRVFQIKRWQGDAPPGGPGAGGGEEGDSMAMDGDAAAAAAGGGSAGSPPSSASAATGSGEPPQAQPSPPVQQQQLPPQPGGAPEPAAAASSSAAAGAAPPPPSSLARFLEPAERVQAGCTAVVAVKYGNELYVANAGDSRGVLCRSGQAIALSEDHKPAHETERTRILNAGGFLSEIGGVCRVNGNLNLSRAIGDLKYKGNAELPAKDQIITAQPDVRRVTLQPEDSFFLLACDGVWDVMSNQEAVEFIDKKLAAGLKPTEAACALLDACLAADPKAARGVGCDNMTAIVVQLKHAAG